MGASGGSLGAVLGFIGVVLGRLGMLSGALGEVRRPTGPQDAVLPKKKCHQIPSCQKKTGHVPKKRPPVVALRSHKIAPRAPKDYAETSPGPPMTVQEMVFAGFYNGFVIFVLWLQ